MDLRTQKTFQSLKNAFLDLLEHYRFEDITVQQLCLQANIRRATFYTHFSDKYDFLSFFITEMRDEFIAEIFEQTNTTSEKTECFYDKLFCKLIEFLSNHKQLVNNLKNSQMLPTMTEILAEEVQKEVFRYLQESNTQDSTNNEMKACFYAGGILQLLKLWMKNPDEFQVDSINWLEYLK